MAISMKAARVNAQLTQREAAKALEISKGTLLNYEKGRSVPKLDMANRMAELYKLAVTDIIFLPNDCT